MPIFCLLSLGLSCLYLFYFKFLYKGDKGKVEKEVLTLKRLSKHFIITLIICLPVFLFLSRPISLIKIFDIDNFNDITHFRVNIHYKEDILASDSYKSLNNLSKENKLEFLDLIKDFKIKRSSHNGIHPVNSDDYPLIFITFYQNKYTSGGNSRSATITNSGFAEIENITYELIDYNDVYLKTEKFILEKNN